MFLDDWDKAFETVCNIAWYLILIGVATVVFGLGVIVWIILF